MRKTKDPRRRSPRGEAGKREGAEGLSFYLLAHIALTKEHKELRTLQEALYPKQTKLLTTTVVVESSAPIEALIDGGSQLNLMSALLAKEQGLTVDPIPSLLAEGANGGEIAVYGLTTAAVTITDSHGHKQLHQVPFVVADVRLDSLSLEVLSYSQIDYRRLFVPFCGCLGVVLSLIHI